ncbi:hypothetical protein HF521_018004 [Silurus meridionalis]|uniref:Uncharacterized protein n=1 Tax=Silurus meridionalis TaxID=175797 RepID=A0A8T0BTV6_SILME|nr:hypothetical protein HF521_018004 [Silurus meridionalis]
MASPQGDCGANRRRWSPGQRDDFPFAVQGLSGAELSGTLCSGAELSETLCSGAELSGTLCSGTELSGSLMDREELTGSLRDREELTGSLRDREELTGSLRGREELTGSLRDREELTELYHCSVLATVECVSVATSFSVISELAERPLAEHSLIR